MTFKELIKKDFIIFDGAMGSMLQKKGLSAGELPERLNFTHPEIVADVIKSYAAAGSDIVCANTFGANSHKLEGSELSVFEVIEKAVLVAKEAVLGYETLIAVDVGSIGVLLEPTGLLKFEEAYEIYKEIAIAAEKSGADLILAETMSDLYELKACVLAVKENTKLPIVTSMTFEENLRTFTGGDVSSFVVTMQGLSVDAVGINCSLGPKQLMPIVKKLLSLADIPVLVKPNAGLPDPVNGGYDIDADEFSDIMKEYAKMGVKCLGGCCGTTPEYIKAVVEKIKGISYVKNEVKKISSVCSPSVFVEINEPKIIGERINPTGKKLFREALKNNDIDYILKQAIEQANAGADILDVNVGTPEIDEKEMLPRVVKAIQSICDLPLQLDSSDPVALENALRIYNGKPIVNSVNGKEESLNSVLPLVKKYGASIVGLTLDEDGIPNEPEKRFAIAEKILNKALSLGIPKEDVFIDCLTLTVSAEPQAATQTLLALHMVKERLRLKTVLGVSNISFGLPARENINSAFLTIAMTMGLDLPIINPNIEVMTSAVRSYRLLSERDQNGKRYIEAYSGAKVEKLAAGAEMTLENAIISGFKSDAVSITAKLLETIPSMEIVNEYLIPTLDKIGEKFEKGILFLPQLIMSAGVCEECFNVIKKSLKSDEAPAQKGKIIIATVHGDIHDIGKNIVKVLLQNYGYSVIDLGRDVAPETILKAAKKEKPDIVGLSALMTTTLPAMVETIKLLKAENIAAKVMVGGAVLTREYAEKIGGDFYAKDAKESVDIAKKVIG